MENKRTSIGKKMRFEVFKRDSFDSGVSIASLKVIAKEHNHWSTWRDEMIALVNDDG